MKVYFVSGNAQKRNEVKTFFAESPFELETVNLKIQEIQCTDVVEIVKDKVKKAFYLVKRPVFVEQTGLYIEDFGGLPGGFTEIMWDTLKSEKFCDFFGTRKNTRASALTAVGYCDGKNVVTFQHTVEGSISKIPQGTVREEWNCIFIPDGYEETLGALKEKGCNVSMRTAVFQKFMEFLKEGSR